MIYFKLKCRSTNKLMFVSMDLGSSSGVGPGPRPPSGRGPDDRVLCKRAIRYRRRLGEPYTLYSPFGQVSRRPCACWYTYSYPDEVVLAMDDERYHLDQTVETLRAQLEEAREFSRWQALRVRDLERDLRDTHQHLFAMKRQLRERARSITFDCGVLLDMAAEAPPRATGPEQIGEIGTLGSVGNRGPRGGV